MKNSYPAAGLSTANYTTASNISSTTSKVHFHVEIANVSHILWAKMICDEMLSSAIQRGTGISKRTPEQLQQKMLAGEAVIAFTEDGKWAGFSYISSWDNGAFVSNSGLIVVPEYRESGVAKEIKKKIFELSRQRYPEAKIFSLTTGRAVMKMNHALGFEPVTYSDITREHKFWEGCNSCVNCPILKSKEYKNCLCTAMMFDPNQVKH